MKVNWRMINSAKNSYAALFAACESFGFDLLPAEGPSHDITCYSMNSVTAAGLMQEMSRADCITIAGGPYATACHEVVARYADYVVVGEGEYTLPMLISHITEGKPGIPAGVATGDQYIPTDTTVFLDAFPPFSRMKGYVEISRGCPYGCAYCQTPRIFGHFMRHRSINQIVAFSSRYRDARFVTPNAFAYGSDGRTPRFDRVEKLLRSLPCRIYFGTFPSEVRPEFICDHSLELVSTYCANTRLHFGAQSGSDTVLKRLGRGHSVADVVAAVELCKDHDLVPVVDFIVGFPFETDEDQRKTIQMVKWVARYGRVHIHRFMPLPGTPLAGEKPRPLLNETMQALGRLSLAGKLTGSWNAPEIRFFKNNPNHIP